MMWLPVKGLAYDEEGARLTRTVPTRPRFRTVAESQLDPQTAHHGVVKMKGPLEVTNAEKDMGKHVHASGGLGKRVRASGVSRLPIAGQA
jgi:hypothetical protein